MKLQTAAAGIGWGLAALACAGSGKEALVQNDTAEIEAATQWVLYPRDIEASKAFYVDKLGFTLAYPFGGGPVKGYQLKAGCVGLTLLSIQGAPVTKVEQMMLHLRVSDVDAYRKLLGQRKVPVVKEVEDTDWGTRWFHVKDPDGLTLALERRKDEKAGLPVQRVNLRFLYAFCNDVPAMRAFYSDVLGMTVFAFQDQKEFGFLNLRTEGIEVMFFRGKKPLGAHKDFASQPGDGGGSLEALSWSVEVPDTDLRATVERIRRSGSKTMTPKPTWRQKSYWGWTVMDPMGNTVEVYSIPKEKPEKPEWKD